MIDTDVHFAAIASGDTAAFATWLAHAEPSVRASLASFARVVDVEAIVQETLLRVWQVAPRFQPDGAANGLLRFAVRIGRNLAISETRRMRTTHETASDTLTADAPAPEVAPPDPFLREAIADCRDRLPPKPRQVLDARLAGGDDEELADALAMKLNTFLQNFTRARQLLVDCLGKKGIAL